MSTSTVYRLIYGSRATPEIVGEMERHVEQIVTTSQRNNAAVGVTGLLLCCRDVFVQVLEGDRTAVETVYARVSRDARHEDVRIVSTDYAVERMFGQWSMCARALSEADAATLDLIGDINDLEPEALDPLPTLNLLSAVAQMRTLARAA